MNIRLKLKFTVFTLATLVACTSCNSMIGLSKGGIEPSKKSSPWSHKAKQDIVYSCHTFVATSLVEAEYHRSTGKQINLSEADLFLKHIKKGMPNWDAALSLYIAEAVQMNRPRNLEIGHVHESYDLIRKYGIAKESEIKYAPLGRIGVPLAMSTLRDNVDAIKQGIKEGESQTELTKVKIAQIKNDGAFKMLSNEGQHFASRKVIKQFISQYNLKNIRIRANKNKASNLKSLLVQRIVGLNYKVPSRANPLIETRHTHTVIITGYDEKKRVFTVRDSDSKGLFGNPALTEEFIQRFATKIYYLEKR